MNPVLIFGATRGVGLELALLLRKRGRRVLTLVRTGRAPVALEAAGVESIVGDALEPADVARAFATLGGSGVVVSTLAGLTEQGEYIDEIGNRRVIDEATRHAVERLILVTSIGCGEMLPYRSERAITAFGKAIEAKTRAEDYLRTNRLPFTILRPGGLLSEPATGRGLLSTDPEIHGFIQRSELAQLIERVMRTPATIGGVYAAVEAERARCANPIESVELLE